MVQYSINMLVTSSNTTQDMNANHVVLDRMSTTEITESFSSTYHILEKIHHTLHHSFVTTITKSH